MFRRSLRAMGRRPRGNALGGRSILVPPKSPYPTLGRPVPLGRPVKVSRSASARRRRNLTYMAVFIIVTFLLGIFPPMRFLLIPNLIADVVLVLYLGLALYMTVWPSEGARDLPPPPERDLAPQRVAGGGSYY